jgi:hypothetical protein
MPEIIVDLGAEGQIIIESADPIINLAEVYDGEPIEKTSISNTLKKTGKTITVNAEKVLKLPLTGLAKIFLMALPYTASNEQFQLDEFIVEFNFGLKTETGFDAGAVAKIMPEGVFKCTYKWKHQSDGSN